MLIQMSSRNLKEIDMGMSIKEQLNEVVGCTDDDGFVEGTSSISEKSGELVGSVIYVDIMGNIDKTYNRIMVNEIISISYDKYDNPAWISVRNFFNFDVICINATQIREIGIFKNFDSGRAKSRRRERGPRTEGLI